MVAPWPASGSRNLGNFVDNVCPKSGPVKRWNGAARTSKKWDGLRKDPELWFRNGNCHIHLYGKGQSKRGPSFKLPFKVLLDKKCFPLIERFLVTEGPAPRTPGQLEKWGTDPNRIVELYIPPPSRANKDQSFVYHVATRNFFAWMFRRSMVGEHLGHALVGLMYSMHEFRADVKDNVQDLMDYMDEEAYLDVVNVPDHALAMLYLAETFQMKDLYIRAFAHCVGMSDSLCASSEYEPLSMTTKKMIRQAKNDMDSRLDSAAAMLNSFLDDDLSESHLGIPSGTRAHLERFRSFLLSHYTNRLGYYPPRAFEPSLYRTMRDEFEALYKLLVDDTYSAVNGMPTVASGGLCSLQLVHIFDAKHHYESLNHPLPLLPDFNQKAPSRLMPWRSRNEKLRPDQKLLAHTALIKASNWREKIFQCELVKAYRNFEEDSVFTPTKADRQEKVSLVDGRKVRWILIYTTYQVLRSVADVPSEVFDAEETPYHVAVSAKDLPPWPDTEVELSSLMRRQTDLAVENCPSIYWGDSAGIDDSPGKIEIKPDINYLAPEPRETTPVEHTGSALDSSPTTSTFPSRSGSVARGLSRSGPIRRSMRMFKPTMAVPPPLETVSLSRPLYKEIVVERYGNGLNNVTQGSGEQAVQTIEVAPWAVRNNSTASHGSSAKTSSPASTNSGDTLESTIVTPTTTTTPFSAYSLQQESKPPQMQKRNGTPFLNTSRSSSAHGGSFNRPVSSNMPGSSGSNQNGLGSNYAADVYEQLVEEQRMSFFGGGGGNYSPMSPKRVSVQPNLVVEDEYAAMQAFMDGAEMHTDFGDDDDGDVKPALEQYADLGGLTEMR